MTTLEHDDRPPASQLDSVEVYAREQALQSEADVLEGLRALDGAEGVKWHVYRINAADPSMNGFLDKWGTVFLTQENLRDKFGPGTYKIRGHYPNGTYAAQRTIEIAGDAPKRMTPEKSTPIQAMDMTQLLVMLDQRDERRRAEEAAKRAEDRGFWKELALTLAPALAPKVVELIGGGGNRGTVTELLTGLKELRALDQPQSATGRNSIKEMLETVALMRDTFDSGSRVGEKGPWDALTELARAAGPKVGAVLEALPQALNVARPNLPTNALPGMRVISSSPQNFAAAASPSPLPVDVTGSPSVSGVAGESVTPHSTSSGDENANLGKIPLETSSTNPTPLNGEDMNLALLQLVPWLRKQLEFLLLKAARNSDPTLYADLLLDNLPDGIEPKTLIEFIKRDDWWTVMQQFDERVAPYAGWFTQFRESLLEGIEP